MQKKKKEKEKEKRHRGDEGIWSMQRDSLPF